jgi:ParB-like chromosome segregation protein Spo0J
MKVEVHPAAELFPLMSHTELSQLAEDIRAHGQREPCLVYQGQLLDGRNRWRACELLGLAPKVCKIKESHKFDPLQYVLSKNLRRRHLSQSQRAMVAARAKSLYQKRARQRQSEGGKLGGKLAGRGRSKTTADRVPENLPEASRDSRDQAGAGLKVSGKSVDHATTVLTRGSRKLQLAVDAGQVAVSRAAVIAKAAPKHEQLTKASETTKRRRRTPLVQLKHWWGKSDPAAQTQFRLWIDKQLT